MKAYSTTSAALYSTDGRGYRNYDECPDPQKPSETEDWRLISAIESDGRVLWFWESEA